MHHMHIHSRLGLDLLISNAYVFYSCVFAAKRLGDFQQPLLVRPRQRVKSLWMRQRLTSDQLLAELRLGADALQPYFERHAAVKRAATPTRELSCSSDFARVTIFASIRWECLERCVTEVVENSYQL